MDTQEFLLLFLFLTVMFALGFLMVAPLRRQLDPDDAENRIMVFIALACIVWTIGISAPVIPPGWMSGIFAVFGPVLCVTGFLIRIRRLPKKRKTYP